MTAPVTRWIVGNWKMHGDVRRLAAFAAMPPAPPGVRVGLALPATLIAPAAARLPDLLIGGQDCHAAAAGAFTGDIAAPMLAEAGARFVILGHSERRIGHAEDDATVRAKASAALDAGLIAILCVGERDRARAGMDAIVADQVAASLPARRAGTLLIAYEPVWAIGSGQLPTEAEIAAAARAITAAVAASAWRDAPPAILYGGSVDADAAPALLAVPGIQGLLVGGASLDLVAFSRIAAATPAPRPDDIVPLAIGR